MSILQNYHTATALMSRQTTAIKTDWRESHPDCAFLTEPVGPRGKGGLNACSKRPIIKMLKPRDSWGERETIVGHRKCDHFAECAGDKKFSKPTALLPGDFPKYVPKPKNAALIRPKKTGQGVQPPRGGQNGGPDVSTEGAGESSGLKTASGKVCAVCGEYKDAEHYNIRRTGNLQSMCKACHKIYQRERYRMKGRKS